MLAFLGTIGGLFGLNPLGKAAKAAGGFALLIVLALLLWGAKAAYDASVIERHDARQGEATAKADRAADAKAGEERREDDARLANEAAELERTQDNAKTDRDRRIARQRCIRLQQAARASGSQPPACT